MLKAFRPHEAYYPIIPPSPALHPLDDHVDAAATLQKMAMPVRHAMLEVSAEDSSWKQQYTKCQTSLHKLTPVLLLSQAAHCHTSAPYKYAKFIREGDKRLHERFVPLTQYGQWSLQGENDQIHLIYPSFQVFHVKIQLLVCICIYVFKYIKCLSLILLRDKGKGGISIYSQYYTTHNIPLYSDLPCFGVTGLNGPPSRCLGREGDSCYYQRSQFSLLQKQTRSAFCILVTSHSYKNTRVFPRNQKVKEAKSREKRF